MSPAEAKIIRPIVTRALKARYKISVFDGEEWVVKKSTSGDVVMEALGSTDSDVLRLRNKHGETAGEIVLVYGNAPDEVVADCTDNARTLAIVG